MARKISREKAWSLLLHTVTSPKAPCVWGAVRTRRRRPCPESQKGNVGAGFALHPQSLTDVGSPVKSVSAQLICNCGQVRLHGFASKEK